MRSEFFTDLHPDPDPQNDHSQNGTPTHELAQTKAFC